MDSNQESAENLLSQFRAEAIKEYSSGKDGRPGTLFVKSPWINFMFKLSCSVKTSSCWVYMFLFLLCRGGISRGGKTDTPYTNATDKFLSLLTGLNKDTISNSLTELEDKGFIFKQIGKGGRKGWANNRIITLNTKLLYGETPEEEIESIVARYAALYGLSDYFQNLRKELQEQEKLKEENPKGNNTPAEVPTQKFINPHTGEIVEL